MGCDDDGDVQYSVDEIVGHIEDDTFYHYPPDCYEYENEYTTDYSYGISVQAHTNGGSSSDANNVRGERAFYLASHYENIPDNLLEDDCEDNETSEEPVCDAVNYYVTHDYDYTTHNYEFDDPDPDSDGDDEDGWITDALWTTGISVVVSVATSTLYGAGAGLIVNYALNGGDSSAIDITRNTYQNDTGEAQEITWDIDMWGKTGVNSFPTKTCESTGVRFVLDDEGPTGTSREFYSSCWYDMFIPAHDDGCYCDYVNLIKSGSIAGVYPTYDSKPL